MFHTYNNNKYYSEQNFLAQKSIVIWAQNSNESMEKSSFLFNSIDLTLGWNKITLEDQQIFKMVNFA